MQDQTCIQVPLGEEVKPGTLPNFLNEKKGEVKWGKVEE